MSHVLKDCRFVKLVVLAALFALLGALAACDSENKIVRGTPVDVQSETLLELTVVDIVVGGVERWRFEARGFRSSTGFTPSHLREHMVQGLPISVRYHEEGEVFVIDDITD